MVILIGGVSCTGKTVMAPKLLEKCKVPQFCKKNNAKFFEINDDYVGEMDNIYKWIDKQVEAKKESKRNLEKL